MKSNEANTVHITRADSKSARFFVGFVILFSQNSSRHMESVQRVQRQDICILERAQCKEYNEYKE